MQLPRLIFAIAVVISLTFGYFIRGFTFIVFPYSLSGLIIIGLGFYLMFWSRNTFNAKRTTIHPTGIPSTLITQKPYSFSRNPMYLGNLFILLGSAIILGNLVYFLAPIIFFTGINQIVIPYEERKLEKLFGSSFERYREKVRRW